jgi:hypothetical protein
LESKKEIGSVVMLDLVLVFEMGLELECV